MELRKQIPTLLSVPLVGKAASIYRSDVGMTVASSKDDTDMTIASSRDELLDLSNSVVLATVASTRASEFVSATLMGVADSNAVATNEVQAKVILGDDLDHVTIEWEINAFPVDMSSAAGRIQGTSQVELDEKGQIVRHRLERVSWNGMTQDASMIAQAMASFRRNSKRLPFSNVVEQLRTEWLHEIAMEAQGKPNGLAPVYYRISNQTRQFVDDDVGSDVSGASIPLPGTRHWIEYAAAHRLIRTFVEQTLPILSGQAEASDRIPSLFQSNARVLTLDESVLMQDGNRVAQFYIAMANWRKRTFGSWHMRSVRVLNWLGKPTVQVEYATSVNVPGGTPPTIIEGCDVYVLTRPDPPTSQVPRVRIEEVKQQRLSVAGNGNLQDSVLLLRSLAAAVETTGRVGADDTVLDLLLRIGKSPSNQQQSLASPVIVRSDLAATTVYRIMDSLHRDIPALLVGNDRNLLPPAHDYIQDNVRLVGYLGEVILKTRANYDRTFRLSLAFLKAALRTGGLVSESDPSLTVELTTERNVRLSATFHLQVKPLPDFLDVDRAVLPLRVSLISDYILDNETGQIMMHKLVESRVNGQLTPGDIVSRWIQRQRSDHDAESVLQSLVSTANWIQSLNNPS